MPRVWTTVQGILAPVQFLAFAVSLVLVLRFLGPARATGPRPSRSWSRPAFLYLIMVTGAIWEKVVFGQYLFAPAFFWEDVFSFAVIALHTLYLYGTVDRRVRRRTQLMLIALAAYATYVINAGQFILKLRRARLDQGTTGGGGMSLDAPDHRLHATPRS